MKLVIKGIVGLSILGSLAGCGNQGTNNTAKTDANQSVSKKKTSKKVQKKVSSSIFLSSESSSNSSSDSSNNNITSSSSKETATTSSVNEKTVGVMVALLDNPNWFKEYIQEGELYYGVESTNSDEELQGYNYITANGDPTSYIYYKIDGESVTYKQWIPSNSSVADGHMETKVATVEQLESDYYSSQTQKSEVDGYANNLKDESSYTAN